MILNSFRHTSSGGGGGTPGVISTGGTPLQANTGLPAGFFFDGDTVSSMYSGTNPRIGYDFGSGVTRTITGFSIWAGIDDRLWSLSTDPITVKGSNTGFLAGDATTIHTVNSGTISAAAITKYTYNHTASAPFRYVWLEFSTTDTNDTPIPEVEFLGY